MWTHNTKRTQTNRRLYWQSLCFHLPCVISVSVSRLPAIPHCITYEYRAKTLRKHWARTIKFTVSDASFFPLPSLNVPPTSARAGDFYTTRILFSNLFAFRSTHSWRNCTRNSLYLGCIFGQSSPRPYSSPHGRIHDHSHPLRDRGCDA